MRAGPEFRLTPNANVSTQAAAGWTWFGGDLYERTAGVRIEGDLSTRSNTRWTGAVRADRIDALINEARDGWSGAVELSRTKYLGPTSLWRLHMLAGVRDSDSDTESYAEYRVHAGRLFSLPGAVLVYVEPYAVARNYKEASAAFGRLREDTEIGASARFTKRDWMFAGAFPFIAVSAARNESTIELYEFSRERMEFGFTREF